MTAVLLRALSVAAALGAATAARSAPRPVTNETSAPSPVSRPRERLLLDGWMDARATWYGGPSGPGPDGMDIFKGSCGFGQMSNHFVTAFNTDGGYDWGLTDKCGQCFEVMCIDGHTRGTSFAQLGPWKGCKEAGVRSVVVQVTDSCPCHHPNTSNKKWCCGDRVHLDLSYAAFDAIAVRDRGVVDLKVRPTSCDQQGQVTFYDFDHSKGLATHTNDQSVLDDASAMGASVSAMAGPSEAEG